MDKKAPHTDQLIELFLIDPDGGIQIPQGTMPRDCLDLVPRIRKVYAAEGETRPLIIRDIINGNEY